MTKTLYFVLIKPYKYISCWKLFKGQEFRFFKCHDTSWQILSEGFTPWWFNSAYVWRSMLLTHTLMNLSKKWWKSPTHSKRVFVCVQQQHFFPLKINHLIWFRITILVLRRDPRKQNQHLWLYQNTDKPWQLMRAAWDQM